MSWNQLKPRALEVLKSTFGFEGFRGVQEEAVKAALEGRDCFVLMPTGGGKSLCYALPAAVTGGLVLVVSPLIALMQDQVSALQAKGVAADYLSSTRSAAERKAILDQLTPAVAATKDKGKAGSSKGGRLALLYVTPELLATDNFRQRLSNLQSQCPGAVRLIAVDEAHCISQWGHDYRPTYRQLSFLRSCLRGVPCMALTATATVQVRDDIVSSLKLHRPAVLMSSFNRPNIHYTVLLLDVQPPPALHNHDHTLNSSAAAAAAGAFVAPGGAAGGDEDALGSSDADDLDHAGFSHLLQLLKSSQRHKGSKAGQPQAAAAAAAANAAKQQSQQQQPKQWPGPIAIVYALKRTTVDGLSRRLRGEGLAAAAYHAALPAATRAEVLEQWNAGQLQVVVASVAFGMGVDKGDIELVVHYNLPRSVEGFYQESGRAGRNGQPARSVLMYSTRDRRRMDWILQQDANKKSSRKRKKQSATGGGGANLDAGGASSSAAASAPDPAVAAAALRAFGGVVDLCCIAGCRRARLLQHFGETIQPQQQRASPGSSNHAAAAAKVQHSCCDYCDDPASVEAAVARLKAAEQELLQRRFNGGSSSSPWSGRHKRRKGTDGHDAFGGFYESSEEGSGASGSDPDVEDGEDSAAAEAAVAAAKAAAAAAVGSKPNQKNAGSTSRGPAGRHDPTSAFLAAMLKAEQAHERKEAAADGDGGGDRLEQLMAKRQAAKKGDSSSALSANVRASRRAKLAEVIRTNTRLAGCTQETATELAAAYEAFVASGSSGNAETHRAGLTKLVAGIKAARSWLQMPEVQLLSGKALRAALQQGVKAVVKAAQQMLHEAPEGGGGGIAPASDSSTSVAAAEVQLGLQGLGKLTVTADALEATGVAATVKKLRKHGHPGVAAAAAGVITAWRNTVSQGAA